MNSRERVMRAVDRLGPDRTPADYKAEPEVNAAVMHHLGVQDYDGLLRKLAVDVRRIEARHVGPPSKSLDDGTVEDYWGIRSRRVSASHGTYDMYVETDVWKAETVADLERHSWPSPDIFDYSVLAEQCARNPDFALLFEGSDLFTRPCILRGMENMMLDMLERPDMAHYVMERFTSFYCEDLTRALEATGGGFQLYCEWSDFGTQQGLLLSVPMWREFIRPYLKRLIDVCHSGGVRFMLHSCGAVRDLIPDFIDIGVDILDPIQVMAVGMDPAGLKKDFGNRLSFHGGVDTQSTLPFGTASDVSAEVRDRVDQLCGGGGGYIIAPSHNIQPDTPIENIVAMYDPALRGYTE
jgi:uroporphyrinogen decarboxylase